MKRVIHDYALIVCASVALALTAAPAVAQKLGKSAVPLNTTTKNQPQSTLLNNQTFTVPSSVRAKDVVGNKPTPIKTRGSKPTPIKTTGSSNNPLGLNLNAFNTSTRKKPALTAVQPRIKLPASSQRKSRISRY